MSKNLQFLSGYFSLFFILITTTVFGQSIPNISTEDAYYKIKNNDEIINSEYMIVSGNRAANDDISFVFLGEDYLNTTSVTLNNHPNSNLGIHPFITQPINNSRLKWKIENKSDDKYSLQNVNNQSFLQIYKILGINNLDFVTSPGSSNAAQWVLLDNKIKNANSNFYLYLSGNNIKFRSESSNIDLYKKFKLDEFTDRVGYEGESFTFLPTSPETGGVITYEIISHSDIDNENAYIDDATKNIITYNKAGTIQVKATVAANGHIPSYSKIITITIYSTVTCFNEDFVNFTTNSANFPTVNNASIVTNITRALRLESNGSIISKALSDVSGTVNVELSIVGYSNSSSSSRRPKVRLSIIKSDNTVHSSGEVILTRRSKDNNSLEISDFKLISYAFTKVPVGSFLKIETVNENKNILWIKSVQIQCNEPEETIWQFQSWSKGKPNENSKAIIREQINENIIAKDLKIETDLIVPTGKYFRVYNLLDVNFQKLTFEKGAYLFLDKSNIVKNGDIGFKSSITSYMYSSRIFSSPVVKAFTGNVIQEIVGDLNNGAFVTGKVNMFKVEKEGGWIDYDGNIFIEGRSVAIRKNTGPKYNSNDNVPVSPEIINSEFRGVPFNATKTFSVENGTYSIGNPYTTPLNITRFLDENKNVVKNILIWRDDNPYDFKVKNYKYPNEYWIECTLSGCANFLNYESIDVGMGFLAQTTNFEGSKNIGIKTSQKTLVLSGVVQNNKTETQKSRYILSLNNGDSEYKSLLIAHIDGATNEYDENYDFDIEDRNSTSINSLNNNRVYTIESRDSHINDDDIVKLRVRLLNDGQYNIVLKEVDGEFESNRKIYLKDNLLDKFIDLSEEKSYQFEDLAGIHDDRFEIHYKNDLLNTSDLENNTELKIYKSNNENYVKSPSLVTSYEVYTLNGLLIKRFQNVNSNHFKLISNHNSIIIYKFYLEDGSAVTKKYIY